MHNFNPDYLYIYVHLFQNKAFLDPMVLRDSRDPQVVQGPQALRDPPDLLVSLVTEACLEPRDPQAP